MKCTYYRSLGDGFLKNEGNVHSFYASTEDNSNGHQHYINITCSCMPKIYNFPVTFAYTMITLSSSLPSPKQIQCREARIQAAGTNRLLDFGILDL